MIRKITLLISLIYFCGASMSFAEELWDFENVSVGSLSENFISHAGKWKVIDDGSGNARVLAQLAENTGLTFNMVLVNDENYQNVDITVKMKAVKVYEDQGGGLVWRAKDEHNYYIARYNPLEDNYRVYKVIKGRRIQLASATLSSRKTSLGDLNPKHLRRSIII